MKGEIVETDIKYYMCVTVLPDGELILCAANIIGLLQTCLRV